MTNCPYDLRIKVITERQTFGRPQLYPTTQTIGDSDQTTEPDYGSCSNHSSAGCYLSRTVKLPYADYERSNGAFDPTPGGATDPDLESNAASYPQPEPDTNTDPDPDTASSYSKVTRRS